MIPRPPKIESAIADGLAAFPVDPLAFDRAAAFLERLRADPAWSETELATVRVAVFRAIVFQYLAKLASWVLS